MIEEANFESQKVIKILRYQRWKFHFFFVTPIVGTFHVGQTFAFINRCVNTENYFSGRIDSKVRYTHVKH